MLALTYPHRTRAHDIPAGWKLGALVLVSALLFVFDTIPFLVSALIITVILHLWLDKRLLSHAIWMMRPIAIFVAIILAYQIYTGEIIAGIALILRIITLVALANLVTMTTRLNDLIAVINRLLLPLGKFGVKTSVFGLAIALVVRFTPTLLKSGKALGESWKARSPKRAGWKLILPLFVSAIDDADHVAEALRARGGL